ncbi:TetR/AcrR family transcriptional regulator [uncultured Maricaulis sp.]|uniref:TetR/AcrR family transcriptional regulator n=1 Tax=uncultured Maricaulis sp. TaxID=174710 RepID=UPI002637F6D6|nr:TetR/AcrR family transcriptional regulator [uncultured Maricaulis sp.]
MLNDLSTTRNRIMRAALDLVAEDGFAAATTAAIARKTGLAEGTLYRHFPSKDELFVAVYRQLKQEVFESIQAETRPDASLRDRFGQLWLGVWNAYLSDAAAFTYGQRFGESPLAGSEGVAHEGFYRHVAALMSDGKQAGLIKPLPANVLRAFFFPPLISMLKQALAGHDWAASDIEAAIDAAWDSWTL